MNWLTRRSNSTTTFLNLRMIIDKIVRQTNHRRQIVLPCDGYLQLNKLFRKVHERTLRPEFNTWWSKYSCWYQNQNRAYCTKFLLLNWLVGICEWSLQRKKYDCACAPCSKITIVVFTSEDPDAFGAYSNEVCIFWDIDGQLIGHLWSPSAKDPVNNQPWIAVAEWKPRITIFATKK